MAMEATAAGLAHAMIECRFLPADAVRDLFRRWRQSAGPDDRLDRFAAWLVRHHVATEYQLAIVQRGHGASLTLGPYRIQERIGKGRMAGVYRATHELGLTLAIKILPPSKAADPTTLARFQREARLAVSVRHPNVVRTFHTGRHGGLYYIVMEYLEGETLDEALARRRRLAAGEAVRLLHQALLGLQAIHEQGMVHRDLKPANLMLIGSQPDSAGGAVLKVLDLGMSRALFHDENDPETFELTRPGETLGAADYVAPEHARGAHNVDIRAAVSRLGCAPSHALAAHPRLTATRP